MCFNNPELVPYTAFIATTSNVTLKKAKLPTSFVVVAAYIRKFTGRCFQGRCLWVFSQKQHFF